MVPVENHNVNTLLTFIKQHMKPGTTIISDRWKVFLVILLITYKLLTLSNNFRHMTPKKRGLYSSYSESQPLSQ